MYQRQSRRYCAVMLAVSVCMRLCMVLGLDAKAAGWLAETARDPEFAQWMLFLETGTVAEVTIEEPEQQLYVLRWMAPQPRQAEEAAPATEPEPPQTPSLPAAAASAEQLSLAGSCTYAVDKADLLSRPSTLDFSGDGPHILIVHTHGSEAYTPEAGYEYQPEEAYRTLNTDRSVIQVGRVLADRLEANGITVIHDETINDYPSYNNSYANTLTRIQSWLTKYPTIQMVLDLHRDAVTDANGNAVALSAMGNGESCAQLMLVVGTDQGGLSHPQWQENLANALKLQSVLQGSYPELCRSLDLRTERFNQHATAGSLLIEVGTNGNTLTQAMHSAELLADGLARLIASIRQTGGYLQTAS